ncbi:unnamed protein product [Phaedon cochleariae]|uniref:Nose resistant-to-fluoxetine protein N-terminal domain-containing protein n=1 Tax=Phaedon cochleariae TaxID=80249 RepID=A0A9P0DTI3_PHACE|nr:unnamed protein product [Phaedon cochleariae]
MIARVRKKFILGFLGILCGLACCQQENDTVVMKIRKDVENVHPRMMISRYNIDMKEKNKRKDLNDTQSTNNETSNKDGPDQRNQKLYFPHNLEVVSDILTKLQNKECVAASTRVLESMTRHEKWAMEMFDSFAKFPTGILYGNYYQMGNYDECVEARKEGNSLESTIQGQYCLTEINLKPKRGNEGRSIRQVQKGNSVIKDRYAYNNTILHWGICLPSSCLTEDAEIFTREIFASAAENFEVVEVIVKADKCTAKVSSPFTNSEIIYGCIVGCFLILTCLATTIHYWFLRKTRNSSPYNVEVVKETQSNNVLREIVSCFSIIHTVDKFLQTKPNELNLECICGIKFLSMSLIIVGHSLTFIFGGPIENKNAFEELVTKLENAPFSNNPLLVDTFLLVSGFLMCRLLLLELEKRKGKINIIILYIARYIRLTPAYVVVIGLYSTVLYRAGSGPLWESRVGLERDRCLKSWWTNVLYINNYVNTDNLCMFQSWYLAVDYHLFIIAPFIIYPIWRCRRLGEILLFVCIVISTAVPFWITYKEQLDPTLMAFPPELEDISNNFYFLNFYIKTHMRASSYCIGIFFGYLVHKFQSSGMKLNYYANLLGSMVALFLGIVSMYSIVIFYNPEHVVNTLENALYASLHRVAWCIAIGWVLLVCITDNAAMINKFLSYKFFIPASRLTYCAYLANGIIVVYNIGVLRQPTYLSKYELACKTFGHVVLTYALAFILCIIFESPIHGLEKILLKKHVKEHKPNPASRTSD